VDSDNRLILAIGAILIVVVAVPVALWQRHETRRPILREARIVTATTSDRVYREGARHTAPGEEVRIALALRLEQPGRGDYWLAPISRLELDGQRVDHAAMDGWPEDDRMVRVFWFSVECGFLGGELSQSTAGERLHYRTFLAPELGRGLRAKGVPAAHADDSLGGMENAMDAVAGTIRLYARAEVVAEPAAVQPLHSATSLGLEHLGDAAFPAIHRSVALAAGIRPEVGELFRLPGFEPAGDTPAVRDQVTMPALGRPFAALVERRLVTSSEAFAATATVGTTGFGHHAVRTLGHVNQGEGMLLDNGRQLRWNEDVRAGDLLGHGAHWMVLVDDDGDGLLGLADRVAHSWRRPAAVEPLLEALGGSAVALELRRWEADGPP